MDCISVSYKVLLLSHQFSWGNNCIGTQCGNSFIFRCIMYWCYCALHQILSMLFTADVYWLNVYVLRIENIIWRILMMLSQVKKKKNSFFHYDAAVIALFCGVYRLDFIHCQNRTEWCIKCNTVCTHTHTHTVAPSLVSDTSRPFLKQTSLAVDILTRHSGEKHRLTNYINDGAPPFAHASNPCQ